MSDQATFPFNMTVTVATGMEAERMAKERLPLAEIARRLRLPYWRVQQMLIDMRVAHRP